MKKPIVLQNYKKKGFDDRIVRYEQIHHVKDSDYEALIKAIDPKEGEIIFEGCAGYADASKYIIEATKNFNQKPQLYILDESLIQTERAKKELQLPENHVIVGDIRETGMSENSFDKTIIKMGIHELLKEEQQKAFTEMYRILKPGGKFVIWELSLNDKNQKVFQDVLRKKDELAGFNDLVKNRYFQKHDELQSLFENAGFTEIKDEYNIRYTFNPKSRFEELVSKDRLEMLREKETLSQENEQELKRMAQERVNALIQYIRQRVSEEAKVIVDFKDLGDDIEMSFNKIIMSGEKPNISSENHNFNADKTTSTGERWDAIYGGYFSNREPLEKFWEIIKPFVNLKKEKVSIVELGSANANLCDFITNKIKEDNLETESFAVDTQKESVEAINESSIKKVVSNIAEWNPNTNLDVILMRSVLHYNSLEKQILILNNTSKIMHEDSVFFNQLLSGDNLNIPLYQKIQEKVFKRSVTLINEEKYKEIALKVFTEVKKIGNCVPIKISAKDMLDRFSKTEIERNENWIKLQNITGWESENDVIILEFPIFEHKK